MKFYLELFWVFFKIGMFTIGGGYAMIPIIKKEVVDRKNWLAEEEFLDALAVAQSAPGVMAVNTAVFVGSKLRKTKGLIVSALGAVLPSFIIILIIAFFFRNVQDNKYVIAAFKGIKPAVISLVLAPAITMSKKAGINYKNFIIPIIIAVLIGILKVTPIIFIIIGMFAGNYFYSQKGSAKK
ncbi:MAG: chromate transporter [Fusobacteriaceae bacterium]